jgi:transcriptional/translational regulatory protein YebC/TACO1
VKEDENAVEIICSPDAFNELKETLDKMGLEADVAEIMRVPENYTAVDSEKAQSMQKLIDWLEDNDDVQNVYHNAEMPE